MAYYVNEWNLETIKNFSDPYGECRIWRGAKHVQGYGMMRYKGKMRTVHSVIAELKYGVKPTKQSGTRVSRTCGNDGCCNHEHIVIKRATDIQRAAYRRTGRFKDEDILEIRNEYDNNRYHGLVKQLSEKWGVSPATITAICKRRLYKAVK